MKTPDLRRFAALVATALAMIHFPPRALAAPAFEKLGSFVGRGAARGTTVGVGADGKPRLYVNYTYLSSLDIVGFEAETGAYQTWNSDEGGAFAALTGPDGRIYFGTYYHGHILRLDPKSGVLDDLGPAVPDETYIWDLTTGPDGAIYGGTFPNCKLFRLDVAAGKSPIWAAWTPRKNICAPRSPRPMAGFVAQPRRGWPRRNRGQTSSRMDSAGAR